jgi:glycosyltransferase involved in cell wall biosynthesis
MSCAPSVGRCGDALSGVGCQSKDRCSASLVSWGDSATTLTDMTPDQPIAIFLPGLGRNSLGGGAERVAVTLAREFVEAGHRVDLVLSVTHPSSSAEVDPRVRIVDLRCRRLWTSLPRLITYRWRERPRVVLSLMPLANSLNVLSAWCGPPGSRAVLNEQNAESIALDAHFSAESTRLLYPVCRLTYPRAAAIIGCSEGVAERVRAAYPTAADRTVGISNPVTPAAQYPAAAPHPWLEDATVPCLVAVGRLHEQKDPLTLLRTVTEIRTQRPIRLLVLGEGPMRTEVEQAIVDLELQAHVQLLGHRTDVRRYLAHADSMLHTARWEGLPVVLLEALAEGVPVVATDCPTGPAEILAGGRYGRLAPVGDVEALAEAVIATLDGRADPSLLVARAADFAPPVIAARYLEVLDRVTRAKPLATTRSDR